MEFRRLEEIHSGWSGDQKYHAWDANGQEFFLRLSPLDKWEKLQQAYSLHKQAARMGLPVSKPLELLREEGRIRYVEEWLPGSMAEDALPGLPKEAQRRLGRDAGRFLKRLHSLPGPETAGDWETRFNQKIDRKIAMYRDCPYRYENGEAFLRYIEENRSLLHGRPQCVQHGDYHTGNMMLCEGRLFIIDFDRPKFGDPWEEFNRIVWCAQLSPAFASGMVDGYFQGEPPALFWRLLALYISSNTLGSLPWALPFGEGEIATMKQQAAEVLDWYDGMRRIVPSWYQAGQEAL